MDTEEKSMDEIEKLKYILTQSEKSFEGTLEGCNALDRKASMFFSVLLTIAIGAISVMAIHHAKLSWAAMAFFAVLAVGLYWSASYFTRVLAPKAYDPTGSTPERWITEGYLGKATSVQLWEGELETNQSKISNNIKLNEDKAVLIEKGLSWAKITPAIALGFGMFIYLFLLVYANTNG